MIIGGIASDKVAAKMGIRSRVAVLAISQVSIKVLRANVHNFTRTHSYKLLLGCEGERVSARSGRSQRDKLIFT